MQELNDVKTHTYGQGQLLNITKFCLNRSALIEASAGTGKTFTITYLVLRLLLGSDTGGTGYRTGSKQILTPLEIEKILVVTFTNASASDLSVRIRETIRQARIVLEKISKENFSLEADPAAKLKSLLKDLSVVSPLDEIILDLLLRPWELKNEIHLSALQCARILQRAERNIDKAPICTIHSFCNRALNQIYAFEAGQAFNVELTNDISEFTEEAQNNVWRNLFYFGDEAQSRLVLEILGTSSPAAVFGQKSCLDELNKVRSEDPKEDFFGFCLQIKPLLVKLQAEFGLRLDLSECQQGDSGTLQEQIFKITACYQQFCQRHETLQDKLKEIALRMFAVHDPKPFFISNWASPGEKGADVAGTLFKNKNFLKGVNAFVTCLYQLKQGDPVDFSDKNLKLSDSAKFGGIVKNAKKGIADYDNLSYTDDSATAKLFEEQLFQAVDLVALIHKKNELKKVLASLLQYLLSVGIFYERLRLCRKHNIISTDDVIWQLNRVLKQDVDKRLGKGTLCSMLQERYPVAMIDEFQDTDPIQFSIFSKIYLARGNSGHDGKCYLIGDPKQSIYAFRGSDINSYLKAKNLIAAITDGAGLYTMNTNFRSSTGVVGAVNMLFGSNALNPKLTSPFSALSSRGHEDAITFFQVEANDSLNFSKPRLYFTHNANSEALANELSFQAYKDLPGVYFNLVGQGQALSKSALNLQQAKTVVLSVLHCLGSGVLIQKNQHDSKPWQVRRVSPEDIAILVRTKRESDVLQKELQAAGIKSVFYSNRESVLSSDSAKLIGYLLEAMCDPTNIAKLKLLLGSRLLGFNGAEFKRHCQDDFFAREITLLKESSKIWLSSGFLSAFSHWFQHELHDSVRRFLKLPNGERILTDLYHISEILQGIHHKLKGRQAQRRWFCELLLKKNNAEFVQRLESENLQIKIITLHGCKGLEYPIVMMPFLYSSNEKSSSKIGYGPSQPGLVYYDPAFKRRTLDLGIESAHLSKLDSDNNLEDMRLLYVALTRAKAAMFLYPSEIKVRSNDELSAFAKLLGADDKDGLKALQLKLMRQDVGAFFKPEFKLMPTVSDLKRYLPVTNENYGKALPSTLEDGAVLKDFQISSYTKVVTGKHLTLNDIEESSNIDVQTAIKAPADLKGDELPLALRTFPKGALGGNFLHELLEKYRFDLVQDNPEQACMQSLELVGENSKYGSLLKRWAMEYENLDGVLQAKKELASWLLNIAGADLGQGLSLNQLQDGDFLQEMRYLIPADKLNIKTFEKEVCLKNALEFKQILGKGVVDELRLKPDTIRGFVTGSLDLVCRFAQDPKHQHYQYFVIDYKSNFLGDAFGDYDGTRLVKSIFASRYDVQLLFYTLALHRFLKNRVSNYAYERDFGGVIYLYLRGLKAGKSSGVFYCKPKLELVCLLDDLFSGKIS